MEKNKKVAFWAALLAFITGTVGMSMLYYLAGWKWNLCVGALMGALYFRIVAYFAMVKYRDEAEPLYAIALEAVKE